MQRHISDQAQRAAFRRLKSCCRSELHYFTNHGTFKGLSTVSYNRRRVVLQQNGQHVVGRNRRCYGSARPNLKEDDFYLPPAIGVSKLPVILEFHVESCEADLSEATQRKENKIRTFEQENEQHIFQKGTARGLEKQELEARIDDEDILPQSRSNDSLFSPQMQTRRAGMSTYPIKEIQERKDLVIENMLAGMKVTTEATSVDFHVSGFSALEQFYSEDTSDIEHAKEPLPNSARALVDDVINDQAEIKHPKIMNVQKHLLEKWHIPAKLLTGKHDRSEYAMHKHATPRGKHNTAESEELNFRGRFDLSSRSLTKLFLQEVYYRLDDPTTPNWAIDEAIEAFAYKVARISYFKSIDPQFNLADVHVNAWVLAASPEQSLNRIRTLELQDSHKFEPPVPIWVIAQVLRSPDLTSDAIRHVVQLVHEWKHHYHWHGQTAIILFIRLLRHARTKTARYHEAITSLFLELIPLAYRNTATLVNESRSLSEWCETALVLIAARTAFHPFRESIHQQRAQLSVLEFMENYEPPILLTRRGYKALARVQVMHNKVPKEVFAAQVQKVTWPPWEERNRMGLIAHQDIDVVQSRTIMVFHRMQEAGFTLDDYDWANHILGGRDTDQSPTIQTRRVGYEGWERIEDRDENGPRAWAARITATRSLRESWMCFCAFDKAVTKKESKHGFVYEAMLQRLVAPSVKLSLSPDSTTLPGDGLEVYTDPELARDQVYIPRPIPSMEDFIGEIARSGVQLTIRALSTLQWHCYDFRKGQNWIAMSMLSDDQKKIMIKPGSHSIETIAKNMMTLPTILQQSYLRMVSCRRAKGTGQQENIDFFYPTYHKGLKFGAAIINAMGGLNDKLRFSFLSALATWDELHNYKLCEYFSLAMPWNDRSFTSLTRKEVTSTILNIQSQTSLGKNGRIELPGFGLQGPQTMSRPADLIRRSIRPALPMGKEMSSDMWYFDRNSSSEEIVPTALPYVSGDAMEAIIWIYAAAFDQYSVTDILDLLQRLAAHEKHVIEKSAVSTSNMCAIRCILEGHWQDEFFAKFGYNSLQLTDEQLAEAKSYCKRFAFWPSTEQVQQWIIQADEWTQRKIQALQAIQQHKLEHSGVREYEVSKMQKQMPKGPSDSKDKPIP